MTTVVDAGQVFGDDARIARRTAGYATVANATRRGVRPSDEGKNRCQPVADEPVAAWRPRQDLQGLRGARTARYEDRGPVGAASGAKKFRFSWGVNYPLHRSVCSRLRAPQRRSGQQGDGPCWMPPEPHGPGSTVAHSRRIGSESAIGSGDSGDAGGCSRANC